MKKNEINLQSLKEILENIHHSENLDSHLWAKSLFVEDFLAAHPHLREKNPGSQLLMAMAEIFREMMPATPPKRGVRLDARWSKFGFLAAKYFAPILFGKAPPESFQDACEKIDQSILLFVYGEEQNNLSEEKIAPYLLMGKEPEITPVSTLSDWHKKGLQRFLEILQARENHLAAATENSPKNTKKRVVWALLSILLILLGVKAIRIYGTGILLYADINQLRENIDTVPEIDEIQELAPLLEDFQRDLAGFRHEIDPFLGITPALKWLPAYGCEISASQAFLDTATFLTDASVESYHAGLPLLETFESDTAELSPATLTTLLVQAQPQFNNARTAFDAGMAAREEIDTSCLSPYVYDILIHSIDPLLLLMDDALTLAIEFPRLVGASSEGPKTYLLLVQNQDELRPTGGFITAAGTLLLQNGEIISMDFESSGKLDNWSKAYPVAPWQLKKYMNSPVLVFRDSNWFPDYPTSALYAEYLYAYISDHSVDGVIAFDQHLLAKILTITGPIQLADADYPIHAGNIITYMREAKIPSNEDRAAPDWDPENWGDKSFISDIPVILMEKIFADNTDWMGLTSVLIDALNEHHLLIQLDNPSTTSLLNRRNWDGAINATKGDFLMVVDSNIGFNKTNALIETSLIYDVDLTNLENPTSNLSIIHKNNADSNIPCVQWRGYAQNSTEKYYPMNRCYWDYLRVYTPLGTNLLEANPQTIPADWMIRREIVPSQVDILEEGIDTVQGFGLLKVVSGGQSLATNFQFNLPASIVNSSDTGDLLYYLKIQKQPGTLATPITIRVHFPNNTNFQSTPAGAIIQDNNVLLETNLQIDREIEILFRVP